MPRPGESGHDSWKDNAWEHAGKVTVWTMMSADEELGYVYLPTNTTAPDFYGGHRPGDNLFAESLVCLDVTTGRRVWHFQTVHHGLWDYDNPAAPNLIDITVNGRRIKAVAQITKQGFVYTFDRVTGEPVWPIVEKPVPPSDVPGERASPTQPFPTKPAPFEYQGVTPDDLVDFTPGSAGDGDRRGEGLPDGTALHAAIPRRHDRAARLGGRRQLVRRRGRPAHRACCTSRPATVSRCSRWRSPTRRSAATCSTCRPPDAARRCRRACRC